MSEVALLDDMLPGVVADGEAAAVVAVENQAAQVADVAAVQEMAAAPEAAAEAGGAQNGLRDYIENNPTGQKIWKFAKWAGSTAAGATAAFGIMYGLNKAIAKNAEQTDHRTALSAYLTQVQATFVQNGLIWTTELKQQAATDALSFPWIDCTQ
jgi:hypothetical protein